jgi:hypothetical protein
MRPMLFALASAYVLAACAVDDESLGDTSQSLATMNKLAGNKLAGNKLAGNKLAGNKLAGNKLAGNKLQLNATGASDLLSTADGREVLTYVVSCAVPDGIVLEATVNGTTYDFPGLLGLAPDWLGHKLDHHGQGWVSACLFARVNAHDTAEEISLRGPHPTLVVSEDEAALYTVEEGAFYGNWFTKDDEPVNWNACRGRDQAQGEFGGLLLRDCAEEDSAHPGFTQCGFKYAGDCADYTPEFPSPYACEDFVNSDEPPDHNKGHHWGHGGGWGGWGHWQHGNHALPDHASYYVDCHGPSGLGTSRHRPEYDEVITVYVAP